jgi:hypothetical protein
VPKKHERNKFVNDDKLGLGAVGATPEIFPGPVTEFVRKTATEIVNNSTTFQDDNELFFPVRASEVWDIEAAIGYTSGGAADYKWQFSVPGTGSSGSGLVHRIIISGTTVQDDVIDWLPNLNGSVVGALGGATNAAFHIRMLVVVGDADGNLTYQWAQNSATLSDTETLAGSWLIARKVG